MDVNTFINKSQQLLTYRKVREAIDYALSAAREADYQQFKFLCLHTLVEICYYYAGDGEATRAWCFALIGWMDKNANVITAISSLREVMEDMYVKQCEIIADTAISYEEYFEYMEKIKSIRPHTELQSGQVDLIKSMQNEGQPWSSNMLFLAVRYAGANDNMGQSNTMYGPAAALYGLMLQNRRKLRLLRTDLKMSLMNYSASIGNLIAEADNYYKNTSGRINPNDYLFMLDKAISIITESKRDVMEPNAGEDELAYLTEQREALMNAIPLGNAVTSPPHAMTIIEHRELLAEIMETNLTGIPSPNIDSADQRSGSSGFSLFFEFIFAAASWYLAIVRGQWWYLFAAFFTLTTIFRLLSPKNRKK